MNRSRYLAILALLWLWIAPVAALADDPTPLPQPTVPAVVEPTTPPAPADTPVSDSGPPGSTVTGGQPSGEGTPVSVTQEQSNPVLRVDQPGNAQPTSAPIVQSTAETGPSTPGSPATSRGFTEPAGQSGPLGSASVPQPQDSSGTSSPPPAVSDATSNPDAGVTSGVTEPGSAAAPGQLKCSGKSHSVGSPFLVSPFSGWKEIVSFDDHDSPDYAVDGTIVIANGLTATASDGQASDLFPSYWSPALRQYISYDGHNGYDFDLNYEPVLAAAAGRVEYAGWNSSDPYAGYGQMVLIRHIDGYVTLYGHLSKLEVHTGDRVEPGQELGISGTTGNSSGPHLHFSVFHDCHVVDPYGWTGHGPDPLYSFDGEHSQYLWLPGHDPLILNPPPGWPTYPLGLHVPASEASTQVGNRKAPPVDRLMLLTLPAPQRGLQVSPAVALARTEAAVTSEAEALAPRLDALRSLGLVDRYQVISAAGAIWVRGTVNAQTLEAMPGVASLSGVQPRDLGQAQSGLAHAVLIQIGRQQLPSLWPVGFHSAIHTWRPLVTVLYGHALVAGFTLPGQQVVVSLHRKGAMPGAAEASADPETGGFVAMIHDQQGNPTPVENGDTVEVTSGGKTAAVEVARFGLRAQASGSGGRVNSHASVSVSAVGHGQSGPWSAIVNAAGNGDFAARAAHSMGAGTLLVASVVDNAGNQEAATACVPGLDLREGSSTVHGWTVSKAPIITVYRHGAVVASEHVVPAPDGELSASLSLAGKPVPLQAGDRIRIGSAHRSRTLTLPLLSLAVRAGSPAMGIIGPTAAHVLVAIDQAGTKPRTLTATLSSRGMRAVFLARPARLGDSATVTFVMPRGDQVSVASQARGLVIHEGAAHVSGQAAPGSEVTLRLSDDHGAQIGGVPAAADTSDGRFSVVLRSPQGTPTKIQAGMQLTIDDGSGSSVVHLPALGLSLSPAGGPLRIRAPGVRNVQLEELPISGKAAFRHLSTAQAQALDIPRAQLRGLRKVILTGSLGGGYIVERSLTVEPKSHRVRGGPAAPKCGGTASAHHACTAGKRGTP